MTGLLVRLKLTLLRNGLRRSPWQVVGLVLGGLYGFGFVAMAVVGLIALRGAGPALAHEVTIVGFTVLTLGWLVLPIFLYGIDNTVDPSRFALFGVRPGELVPGLWLAGLIGLPALGTLIVSLALVGTWSVGVLPAVVGLLTAVVGTALCVLWSRAVLTWLSGVLRARKFRDLAIVAFMVLVLGASLGLQVLTRVDVLSPEALRGLLSRLALVLGWTPFGWVWGLPGAVALGQWLEVAARIVLTAGLIVGLLALWRARLAVELTSPLDSGAGGGRQKADSFVDRLVPATPYGAVAGRTLRYWRRDPRYQMALVSLLVLPVFLIVVNLVNDEAVAIAAWAPVLVALIGGSSIVSDLAYDNSAFGLHVLSGVSGRDDRRGRVTAYLWVVAPTVLIAVVVTTLVTRSWELVPAVLALSTVALLAGLGSGAAVSGFLPGKVKPPGGNAFSSSGGNLQSFLGLMLTTGATTVVAVPTVALVVGSMFGPSWLAWIAIPVAAGCGAAALVAGIRIGGQLLDRRAPELLAAITS